MAAAKSLAAKFKTRLTQTQLEAITRRAGSVVYWWANGTPLYLAYVQRCLGVRT
jgi:hypothetical protein